MAERRYSTGVLRIERRGQGDEARQVLVGHAAVFDQWTTLYEGRYWIWREVVRPKAFARAIKEKQDVRGLWNHDANFVLGRTISGTLELREDSEGLLSTIDPPGTQTVRDLVIVPIDRGDVSGMSFAFDVRRGDKIVEVEHEDGTRVIDRGGERITLRYEGDRVIEERELLDLDLFDVSPVTYPAYEGTNIGLRGGCVPDLQDLIREKDRPNRRPAPRREAIRQWLESHAGVAGGASGTSSAR